MSGKIFLSPLRSEDRLLAIPAAGRWLPVADFLGKYSSDITLEGQIDDRQLVQSVPTVFARPIQFYQALENQDHPAHASVVGQWRGLLAIFALEKWLGVTVETKEFSLSKALGGRSADKASSGADLPLLTILQSQLPQPAPEWERWWLIYCDGRLLGATSPWSLVYTPAEYACPTSVPWQQDGVLADPAACLDPRGNASSRELALLVTWLDRVLAAERERWGVTDRPHLEAPVRMLVRELHLWRKELKRHQDTALGSREFMPGGEHVREDPYGQFLVPLDTEGVASQSDFFLDSKTKTDVLAFSRLGAPPSRRVHGSALAGQVDLARLPGPSGEAGWMTSAGKRIDCPYIIAEEAFFPPRLAQINLSEEALSFGDNRKFALPLTSTFFRHFDLDTLVQKRLLVELAATETRVVARLRLPLRGGDFLYVERVYDRETEVVQLEAETPALALWPDFVEPNWHHNFALASSDQGGELRIAPLTLSGGTLLASSVDGREKTLRLWESTEPLLGFALLHVGGEGLASEAGVVLRRAATGVSARDAPPWTVAVDFGTSSTHLMVREGDGEARPLELKKRKVILTAPFIHYELAPRMYPDQPVLPPFPTLLFRNEATLVQGRPSTSFREDLYTPRLAAKVEDFLYTDELELVVKDLKWAARGGARSEVPIREYLTALVRAVACEACERGIRDLTFEWSFPLSLPENTRGSMAGFWLSIAATFSIPEVLSIQAKPGVSESEAICRYLAMTPSAGLPILANSLSLAIDVGGGSTDVGFWAQGSLLGQVSLKLAGNDLVVPLVSFPGFWPGLLAVCAPKQRAENVEFDRVKSNPAVPLNALLTQATDARGQRFQGDPREHPVPLALGARLQAGEVPWSIARSGIYLFATGLCFFLGLHARKWIDDLSVKSANLRFGGRGANLFPWVARDDSLAEILGSAFVEGVSQERPQHRGLQVTVVAPGLWHDPASPLKGEVARGLLCPALGGEKPDRPTTTIVGELGWTDPAGDVLTWDAEVDARRLEALRPPPNPESGYAAHFLAKVVPRHAEKLSLDLGGLSKVRLDYAKVQNHLRSGLRDGYEVLQPVFAVELKALLEDYLARAGAANA